MDLMLYTSNITLMGELQDEYHEFFVFFRGGGGWGGGGGLGVGGGGGGGGGGGK